jgi:hypothetical protein
MGGRPSRQSRFWLLETTLLLAALAFRHGKKESRQLARN